MPSNTDLETLVTELSKKIDDLTEKVNWGNIDHRIIISGYGPDEAKAECRCGWSRNYFYPFSGPKYRQFPEIADKARRDHKAEHDEALVRKTMHVFTRTITHKDEPCGNSSGHIRTDCSCGTGYMRTVFGYRDDPRKPIVGPADAERQIRAYEETHKLIRGISD